MAETTVMILMGLLTLLGLTALVLGFVVLLARGGSFRLSLRGVGMEVESTIEADSEDDDSDNQEVDIAESGDENPEF